MQRIGVQYNQGSILLSVPWFGVPSAAKRVDTVAKAEVKGLNIESLSREQYTIFFLFAAHISQYRIQRSHEVWHAECDAS